MTFKGWTRGASIGTQRRHETNWRYWAAPVSSVMTGSSQPLLPFIVAVGDD